MKTIIRLAIVSLLMAFSISCDDDEKDPEQPSIVGQWKGDRSEIKAKYGIIVLYEETDEVFDVLLELNEDGTAQFTRDGTETNGTYHLNGDELHLNVDLQVDGVDLSDVTFDVVELSETKLRLHMERDQQVEVPDYGNVTATVVADLTFDRL